MRLLIAVLIAALATIGQAQAPASPFLTSGAEVCCGTQSPGTNSWRTETAARGTTSAPDRAAFGQMPDVRGIAAPAAATIATVLSQPHGDFEPQQERLTASHDQRHLFSTGSGVIHSVWSFQRERLAVTQFNYDDRNNLVSARISIATRGIATPYGVASQQAGSAAKAALSEARAGGTLYRQGSFGVQETTSAQFWSPRNPLATPGYANSTGLPGGAAPAADWVMGGTLKGGAQAVTRASPGLGANAGGAIEVVTTPGGVGSFWFHMP